VSRVYPVLHKSDDRWVSHDVRLDTAAEVSSAIDYPAFSLMKGTDRVEARLADCRSGGTEYRLSVNGRFVISRRFQTGQDALEHFAAVRWRHLFEGWRSTATGCDLRLADAFQLA